LRASLIEPPPSRLRVGRGTAIFLHGRIDDASGRVRSLRLQGGGARPPVDARLAGREWWAILPLGPIASREPATFALHAQLESGREAAAAIAEIELLPEAVAEPAAPQMPEQAQGASPVAICMGTHNPPLDLFERQVESIRAQTHSQWLCVISDDASSPERLEGIQRIVGDDPRFALFPSEQRLGFYANFERALSLAPREATHVALCDQDDRWYPEKLETLLTSLDERDTLAYSDMRIVTPAGELLSDTYWKYRRNNWTDLGTLLIGNTITGSASLFRRSLLDYALPFPPRLGDAFHDHWLALVALACGSVRYLDRPLQDYVQHPGAVIGFSSANAGRGFGVGLAGLSRRARRLASRLVRPEARRRYFADYSRIALLATVLDLRCGELIGPEKRASVESIRGLDDSLAAAARLALRSFAPGNETMGVDRSVLAGLAWSRLARARSRSE
jgi:glycosyltransferase involved in cell wall biosynthesis